MMLTSNRYLLIAGVLLQADVRELSVAQAVDLLDAATSQIRSYDVLLETTQRWLLKQVRLGSPAPDGRSAPPVGPWVRLDPGEKPLTENRYYRQVCQGRRRRLEVFDPDFKAIKSLVVLNGEESRTLNRGIEGFVGPEPGQLVPEGTDYSTFYRTMWGLVDRVELLRRRKGTRLDAEALRRGAVVLEGPPEEMTELQSYGLRVWLDPAHGMMPNRLEMYDKAPNIPSVSVVVDEFKELDGGVWAPIRATTAFYVPSGALTGQISSEVVATVDIANSSWNSNLDEGLFRLDFAPGTPVIDRGRNTAYITGGAPQRLDRLAEEARASLRKHPYFREGTPPPQTAFFSLYSVRGWLVILNAVIVLAAAGWIWHRRRVTRVGRP